MTASARCTRAEASDVANSIFDGTDAIMLSGETASGQYPLEAVRTMAEIAQTTEAALDYAKLASHEAKHGRTYSTDAIAHATVQIAREIEADAILSVTSSGFTARNISKYRSSVPVVAVTQTPEVCRSLQLFWGVEPIVGPYSANTDEMMELSVQAALDAGCISQGDSLVLTAGIPIGKPGSTNMIKVINLGRKLLSGAGVGKQSYAGTVCVCRTTEDFTKNCVRGWSSSWMSLMTKRGPAPPRPGPLSPRKAALRRRRRSWASTAAFPSSSARRMRRRS